MTSEDKTGGIRGWVDVEAIRHLVKHASASLAALLLLALFAWLLHLIDNAELLPKLFVSILEWTDLGTMAIVFVLFGAKTIKYFAGRISDDSTHCLLA